MDHLHTNELLPIHIYISFVIKFIYALLGELLLIDKIYKCSDIPNKLKFSVNVFLLLYSVSPIIS